MKRAICFCVALCLAAGLFSGCASSQEKLRIDLIVKGTETEFWQSVNDGAQAAASQYGVDVKLFGPKQEEDYRQQADIIYRSVERCPDAIVLAASDFHMAVDPMETAVDAGIPVVMVDSSIDSEKWVSFVGTDNVALGKRLAQELKARLPAKGTVGVVNFVKDSHPAKERESGFLQEMGDITGITILDTAYCDSNFDIAETLVSDMLDAYPDLVAVAGLNAQSATGAGRALDEAKNTSVILAAIDCTVEEADFMERGIMDVALLQNPYLMGYYSVETAVRHLKGKKVERIQHTEIYVVTRETMFDEENRQLIFPFD